VNPVARTLTNLLVYGLGCLALIVIVVLVGVVISVGNITGGLERITGVLNQWAVEPPPNANVSQSPTIVNQVRPLGQLVSTSAQLAKADITVNIAQGRFGQCGYGASHVAQATIDAGIDLQSISPDAVQYDETTDTYTITVPAPIITSCRMDFIDQYSQRTTLIGCNPSWDDARQIAQYEGMIDFRNSAIEGGILRRAQLDAETVLTNFVGALTGSNVQIVFEPASSTFPANCNPEAPRNWTFDPVSGAWTRIE
jgi:hypothetical protein